MSMNEMSFESRLTIITTDVGSLILMAGLWPPAGLWAPTATVAMVLASAATRAPPRSRLPALNMTLLLRTVALESRLKPHTREQIPELAVAAGSRDDVLEREGEPQPLGQLEIVIALRQPLLVAGVEIGFGVADAPGVERVERQPGTERETAAPEVILVVGDVLLAVACEQDDARRELLVDAETERMLRFHLAVVGPEPDPVVALGERERRRGVADFEQRVQEVAQVRGVVVALLNADAKAEPVLRIVVGDDARAVRRESEHLVVHQRVTDELGRLVVGAGVAVEVVGQLEPSRGERQSLPEDLGPQPHLAQIELVRSDEPRRIAVEQRQRGNLVVGRRPTQGHHVSEERRVLRQLGGEEEVGGRQPVSLVVHARRRVTLGQVRCLEHRGGIDANSYRLISCRKHSF